MARAGHSLLVPNFKSITFQTTWVYVAILFVVTSASGGRYAPEISELEKFSYDNCGKLASTEKNDTPWLVKIKIASQPHLQCLGVLISDKEVLTSAFCLKNDNSLGDVKVAFQPFPPFEWKSINRWVTNKNYSLDHGMSNNIAVLKFEDPITDNKIRPICIWNKGIETSGEIISENNGKGTVIGQEKTDTKDTVNIQKVDLQVHQPLVCMEGMESEVYAHFFENGHICAKYFPEKIETCIGGFGAPLQFKIGDRWFLRGIYNMAFISKVAANCSNGGIFSFTDVARHLKFIAVNSELNWKSFHIPTEPNNNNTGLNKMTCGKRNQKNNLIMEGTNTNIEHHPWMAQIFLSVTEGLSFQCGGALISHKFVLSAAHCFKNVESAQKQFDKTDYLILFGKTNKSQNWNSVMKNQESHGVDEIIIHEEYIKNPKNNKNDIALLRLEKAVEFRDEITPVCIWSGLYDKQAFINRTVKVAGWGLKTGYKDANQLQEVNIIIHHRRECNEIMKGDSMICAGNRGAVPCNGDSGGPLVIFEGSRFYVLGIVSVGKKLANETVCDSNYPVLFTEVALFRDWIEMKVSS